MFNNIEIVVARYNEDLNWTKEYPFNQFKYTIYNKGTNDNFAIPPLYRDKIIQLPNVGRCDHTYLYHIVSNYTQLAPITIFLPGSTQLHYKKVVATRLINYILASKNAVFLGHKTVNLKKCFANFSLDKWSASDPTNLKNNNEANLEHAFLRPYRKWYTHFFGNTVVQKYCYMSIFSIRRLDIIKHDINRYKELLNAVSRHSNPEVGHYIERSWGAIFHPLIATKFIAYN
jgi:hypothetical protein